jgi:hypothetical protein
MSFNHTLGTMRYISNETGRVIKDIEKYNRCYIGKAKGLDALIADEIEKQDVGKK